MLAARPEPEGDTLLVTLPPIDNWMRYMMLLADLTGGIKSESTPDYISPRVLLQ